VSKSVALLLVLVFLTASCLVVAKPVLSSADIVEDTWSAKAPMQQARAGLGVVVVNGKIYAIGGTIASGQYPPDVSGGGFVGTNEEYDPAAQLASEHGLRPPSAQVHSRTRPHKPSYPLE
jgi:hypothetical protein